MDLLQIQNMLLTKEDNIYVKEDWMMQDYAKKLKYRIEKSLRNIQQNITTTKTTNILEDTSFLDNTKVKFI